MKQQIKVLKACLEEATRKKDHSMDMATMFKRKMINAEVKHHHLLGKITIALREIQAIRDFAAECHEKDLAPDTFELFEDLQGILDGLKVRPHEVFFKMKHKRLFMDQFNDKEWTIIVWNDRA